MSNTLRMFTVRLSKDPKEMDILCCIPVDRSYDGPETMEFAMTPALCIYYRGPYEGIPQTMGELMRYVKENNVEVTGPFRSIYLEGPPNRGADSENYVTQVAVPIKE